MKEPVYCLQFYVCLGPESPLDERQIMKDWHSPLVLEACHKLGQGDHVQKVH
jgi:hypothetical protein